MMKLLTASSLMILLQSGFASETVKGAKKDLDSFKQQMSVELQTMENNLKKMSATAEKKSDATYKKAIEELTVKRDKLRSDLYDLKADTKGEWKETKSKISASLNSLNEKIQSALKD